ncbi:hypothetical protein Bca52824_030068 [Brassica carinata]|uniref:Mediator complex subunit 15 KIX domain-containing protein n=1 Tax=Brassica carinata TaxID=52824 RepID=A0A8X7S7Y6_BRACI|nr:hypothetical protein Bca52824_030068 [Brassica carinata]
MEGNSNWKTNEQGRDSLANNANDIRRSAPEPDLRKRIIFAIVEKLKICFPKHSQNDINNTAFEFEGKIYGMATDKDDYLRKISEKIMVFDKKFRSVQSGSSVNETNTPDPAAQVLKQGQPLPTSLAYTQTPTSQQWFPQNNIHEYSGFSTQVPITVSAAKNLNIQKGEGVHPDLLSGSQIHTHGRQQFSPQPQQQPHSSSDKFQHQVDQQLLKENIHHLQLSHMQEQQSLLEQPVQQQFTHQTSLSTIHQPFPQSSSLFSLTSPGQQNFQFLPRHQFPTQRVYSSHQQPMYVPSQELKRQEHEQLISQLMNGQVTQQNHLPSLQNNGEQQGAFTVSSSQQKNIASFQEMGQQNSNLHNMHQQQHLYSHSNNASSLASQQQTYMPGGQSCNFNVYESSLLGTQGQEVGQSQPMMLQQYQQPQNRILHQHLDDTQRFQAACSFHQIQNVVDQQNHQPYQLQIPANPSTSQDFSCKMVTASGGDWQEETYQKIKALKEKYLPILSTLLQKVSAKLQEVDSLPQQKMQHEPIQKLRAGKTTLELVIVFLNVSRNNISESHRERFSLYKELVLRLTKNQQTVTRSPMQHQQSPNDHNQHSNISPTQSSMFHQKQFHHLQIQHQLLQSRQQQQPQTNQQQPQIQNHSSPQLVDQLILPSTLHSTGTSSRFLVSPFVAPSPSVDLEKPITVDSPVSHDYQLQTAPQEQPIDRLIKAFQSSSPESLAQSITEMSYVINLADMLAGSVHSIGRLRDGLAEDLSASTLFRLQQEETNVTKKLKRPMTTQLSSKESEADSTASSGSKAQKIEPGCALLQEIKDINGILVETVVNISNEDVYPSKVTSGTIVTCSYSPVALSDTLEARYKSGLISQIQPLRLLVPVNYPYSPILLLEKVPFDASLQKYDDLSARTRSRFSLSMKEFSEPMSLKDIAQVWDVCARETIAEYAEQHGGGTFSTKYGHWEPVPEAS